MSYYCDNNNNREESRVSGGGGTCVQNRETDAARVSGLHRVGGCMEEEGARVTVAITMTVVVYNVLQLTIF